MAILECPIELRPYGPNGLFRRLGTHALQVRVSRAARTWRWMIPGPPTASGSSAQFGLEAPGQFALNGFPDAGGVLRPDAGETEFVDVQLDGGTFHNQPRVSDSVRLLPDFSAS